MSYHWIDTLLEAYIAIILTIEYLWGRSDTDLKKEEKRAKKSKPTFDSLTQGESK